jgi:cytochrome b561
MNKPARYHSFAIVLHWAMALGVAFMIGSGMYMVNGDLPKAQQFDLYQIHKASGVVVLWAAALRVVLRFMLPRPALPSSIPPTQRRKAAMGHVALYCLLFIIPIAGWVMVSASPFGLPTFVFFDWLKWPHIPGIARNKTVAGIANAVHWYGVLTLVALLCAHIGAVVLHKIKHSENLLKRMWW